MMAHAGENPGVTGAPVLQIPLGARAMGMGSAFTGVASDISALYYNPAGLSNLDSYQLSFMYLKGLEDQNLEYIAAASPLPISGIIGAGYSTLGAGILLSQNGTIEVNRTNPDGSFRDTRTLNAGGDMVATVGYSERLADFPVELRRGPVHLHHFMGASVKLVRSTLAETYSATAYAADVGYLIKVPEAGLSLGASLLNLGSRLRFIEEGDPLPLTARFGFGYNIPLPETTVPPSQILNLAADSEYLYYERQWRVNTGIEYVAMKRYAARLGYQLNRDLVGLTIGFGLAFRGLSMDYAWAMTEALNDTHRFTFTYRFGKVPERSRERQRRPFIESMPEREELRGIEQETPRDVEPPRRPRRTIPPDDRGAPGWIY